MENLSRNRSALGSVLGFDPRLPDDDGRVRLDTLGAAPVLLLATAGGTVVTNSRRNPLDEAHKALDTALRGQPVPDAVVVIGLGLGFIIDAVEERCPRAKILGIEPEPGCLRHLLDRRDLTGLLSSGRLGLFWGPDYQGSGDAWRWLAGDTASRVTVVNPVLARHAPDAFRDAEELVKRMVFGARSNAEARKRFAGRYLLNTLRNLPVLARSGSAASLFGAFQGTPGVVVSAGPSLDTSLDALRRVADRAVLVAVDTALRPLLAAGIQPHLVVAIDPSEVNGRHLRDLADTGRCHLVAEPSIDPDAFSDFAERIFTFRVADHEPWPWLRGEGLDRPVLRAWGSVATSAFDLVLQLGCNPVVFAGQDLAYTGGRPYCRGTTYEADWALETAFGIELQTIWNRWLDSDRTVDAPDLDGRVTKTSGALVAFRDWLVEQFGRTRDRTFINASGAGILSGPHVKQGTLADIVRSDGPIVDPGRIAFLRTTGLTSPNCLESPTERLLDSATDPESSRLIEGWRRFTLDTVDPDDVRSALEESLVRTKGFATLGRSIRSTPPVLLDRPGWASGGPAAGGPPDDGALLALLVGVAGEAAVRLLSSVEPLVQPAAPLDPGGGGPAAVQWTAQARKGVQAIERAATFASGGVRQAPVAERRRLRPWAVSRTDPSGTAGEMDHRARDWWARREVVLNWASLADGLGENPHVTRSLITGVSLADWLADVADVLQPVPPGEPSVEIALHVEGRDGRLRSGRLDLSVPLHRLARVLTGVIAPIIRPADLAGAPQPVEADLLEIRLTEDVRSAGRMRLALSTGSNDSASADPRTAFLRSSNTAIRPKILGLPSSFTACGFDAETALVTPFGERSSVAVDATGSVTTLPAWPRPIVGELHGPGNSVAWSNAGYLMRRCTADAEADIVDAPFVPGRALVLEDGTSYWSAVSGGLWCWTPAGTITRHVSTPPAAGLALEGGRFRVDPIGQRGGGERLRERQPKAWLCEPATGTVEDVETGPLGQRWRLATRGHHWAAAHPCADLVRLGDASGARLDLACELPVDVAWAGASLVVLTGHGEVLLFESVGQLLG